MQPKQPTPPTPHQIETARQMALCKQKIGMAGQIYISMHMNPKYFNKCDEDKTQEAFDSAGVFMGLTTATLNKLAKELKEKEPKEKLIHIP